MKVKNIMFSGFAAAILMGVGAANAITGPVTLAEKGYVDQKVGAVAEEVATKQASAKKMSAETAQAADLAVLEADEDNYPSVAAAVEIADKKAKDVVKEINQTAGNLSTLKDNVDALVGKVNTDGTVADAIAGALAAAKGDATTKADKALADAKDYTNTKVGNLGTAENVVAYVDEKADAAEEAAIAAANSAAALAIENSGHAKAEEVAATYETKTDAGVKLQAAKDYADSAVAALNVAETYETKANATSKLAEAKKYTDDEIAELNVSQYATKAEITEANYASQTEAQGYATAAVNALGIADYAKTADVAATYETKESAKAYAKTADVTAELAKKLDKTAINNAAGTYMVTSDGAGNFTYTQVKVATGVAENGDAVVTQ